MIEPAPLWIKFSFECARDNECDFFQAGDVPTTIARFNVWSYIITSLYEYLFVFSLGFNALFS